jgi:hypothetical protein
MGLILLRAQFEVLHAHVLLGTASIRESDGFNTRRG